MMKEKEEKRVPQLRFPEFTDDWEQRKLGELGTITTGSTPSTSIPDYYSDDGIVWVTPTDICENITFESARKLSDLGQQVGRVVPKNTILVTCIASIGKNTMLGNTGSFNQQINGLTPNENECDPYFLLTESALWSAKMKSSAAAGTMQIVNRTEFSELKTWLPSLIEQQAISDFFRQLDNLITLHQRKLEKLKELRKGVMKKLFSQEVRFKADDGSEFSEWEKKKIGDVFSKIKDKNKDGRNQNVITNSAEFGLINQRDFFDKDIAVDGKTENYTVIKTGDFVYNPRKSKQAPYGPFNCYQLEENGIVSPLYTCLRPKSNVNDKYLLWYFKSGSWYRFIYENGAQNGARHDRVGMTDSLMQEIPVYLPQAVEEQQKIAECLSALDDVIEKQKATLAAWEELKKGLLQQMFV